MIFWVNIFLRRLVWCFFFIDVKGIIIIVGDRLEFIFVIRFVEEIVCGMLYWV